MVTTSVSACQLYGACSPNLCTLGTCTQLCGATHAYLYSRKQVYKESITKRLPGHLAEGSQVAQPDGIQSAWLTEEQAQDSSSFTRVIVSGLKPDVLQHFDGGAAENVCRQLAHLYHYYLHGPDGNCNPGVALASSEGMSATSQMPLSSNASHQMC